MMATADPERNIAADTIGSVETAAARAWRNHVVRRNIVEFLHPVTLPTDARLNSECFRTAVQRMWSGVATYNSIDTRLYRVFDPVCTHGPFIWIQLKTRHDMQYTRGLYAGSNTTDFEGDMPPFLARFPCVVYFATMNGLFLEILRDPDYTLREVILCIDGLYGNGLPWQLKLFIEYHRRVLLSPSTLSCRTPIQVRRWPFNKSRDIPELAAIIAEHEVNFRIAALDGFLFTKPHIRDALAKVADRIISCRLRLCPESGFGSLDISIAQKMLEEAIAVLGTNKISRVIGNQIKDSLSAYIRHRIKYGQVLRQVNFSGGMFPVPSPDEIREIASIPIPSLDPSASRNRSVQLHFTIIFAYRLDDSPSQRQADILHTASEWVGPLARACHFAGGVQSVRLFHTKRITAPEGSTRLTTGSHAAIDEELTATLEAMLQAAFDKLDFVST